MFFVVICLPAFIPSFAVAEIIDTKVVIDHSNFTLVSSRRVTRTVSEYTIRAAAKNLTATEFNNVTAKITTVPGNMTIIDGNVNFGRLAANATLASTDEFTIQIDLRQAYSLADIRWEVSGDPVPAVSAPSAVGIFMSIDKNTIKGDVSNKSHKDWIEVIAWSEGSNNSGTTHLGSGAGAGKFNLGDVSVSKFLDSASVDLRRVITLARDFQEVQIDVIKDCGGNKYTQYAITLHQVMVSSLSSGASSGQDRLLENVTFNTASIETMYTPVGKDCRFENPIYSFVSYK